MAANPNVPQGTLNRLVASVSWNSFPALNVTAPYLGRAGLSLALEGEATSYIPTFTGAVTSLEPYFMFTMRMALLRTQPLGQAYKARMELNSLLGNGTIRPDTSTLSPFQVFNASIKAVQDLSFDGTDPGFMVTIGGYYQINSDMWNLA